MAAALGLYISSGQFETVKSAQTLYQPCQLHAACWDAAFCQLHQLLMPDLNESTQDKLGKGQQDFGSAFKKK